MCESSQLQQKKEKLCSDVTIPIPTPYTSSAHVHWCRCGCIDVGICTGVDRGVCVYLCVHMYVW